MRCRISSRIRAIGMVPESAALLTLDEEGKLSFRGLCGLSDSLHWEA
jgi:hypothetical protein